MGKKESVPKREYTEEFKAEAVKLGMSIGGNATAKRLGIPQSTMTNWIRRSKAGALPEPAGSSTQRPVWPRLKVGCTWLRLWIWPADASWAGRWAAASMRRSSAMHCAWPTGDASRRSD